VKIRKSNLSRIFHVSYRGNCVYTHFVSLPVNVIWNRVCNDLCTHFRKKIRNSHIHKKTCKMLQVHFKLLSFRFSSGLGLYIGFRRSSFCWFWNVLRLRFFRLTVSRLGLFFGFCCSRFLFRS